MSESSLPKVVNQEIAKPANSLWVVILLICGIQMADTLTGQGVPVLYPFIREEFGLTRAQLGFITSAYSMGGLTAAMLAGWLTDRMGVRKIGTFSLIGMTVFTLAIVLSSTWLIILVLMAFIGIVSSPGYPASTQAIMDWVPIRIRALAMGLKQTGVPIGGAIMAAVLPSLTIIAGWRVAAASMGVLVLIFTVVFASKYSDAPRNRDAVRKSDASALKAVLKDRGLVVGMVWAGTLTGFHFIVLSYFMLFLMENLGFSPIVAGGALAIVQISSGFGRVLWGAASDFLFHGRRIITLAITGFLTVLWLVGVSLMNADVPTIVVYFIAIVIGVSTLSYQGVFTTLVGELAGPGRIGVTAGIANTFNRLGILLMPPLFGYLVDVSGSYNLIWRLGAVVALAGTLALMAFSREPDRSPPSA